MSAVWVTWQKTHFILKPILYMSIGDDKWKKKMLKSLFLNPDVCIVLLLLWLFCVDGRVHNLPAVFSSVLKTSISLERSIHVLIIM